MEICLLVFPNSEIGNRNGSKPLLHSQDLSRNMLPLQTTVGLITDRIKEKYGSMHKTFQYFDSDSDGKINLEDFIRGLESMNLMIMNSTTENIFRILDGGKKGYLNYSDFSQLVSDITKLTNYEANSGGSNTDRIRYSTPKLKITKSYDTFKPKSSRNEPSSSISKLGNVARSQVSINLNETETKLYQDRFIAHMKSESNFASPVIYTQEKRYIRVPKLSPVSQLGGYRGRYSKETVSYLDINTKLRTSTPGPKYSSSKSRRDMNSSPLITKVNSLKKKSEV